MPTSLPGPFVGYPAGNATGGSQFGAYAIRIARLDPTGVHQPGANNLYIPAGGPIEVKTNWNVKSGNRFEQRSGAGAVCAVVQQPDEVQGLTLNLKLCQLDAELLEILTNGTIIPDVSGANAIGYMVPPLGYAAGNGVSFEWWDSNRAGNSAAPNWPWTRWMCPKTTWRIDSMTNNEGLAAIDLVGVCYENPNGYNGPANDWDIAVVNVLAFQLTKSLPSPMVNHYQTLAAS